MASFSADQFLTVACMGFMTNPAGTPLSLVNDMHVMEVLVAIAESGIDGGVRVAEQILFVTVQTRPVDSILVGSIDVGRILSPEDAEVIGAVRVMTCLAFTLPERAMQIFFPGKFLLDIIQARSAKIVLVVAAKTNSALVTR